ncbi:MAG: type I glyceraldehyde-3-phosphate dehydrogenase [Gemmatimonadetes bacterium]|nr:type I glyceraldehyde-3-phosphate dehydrogenase [Gemmatimonadota bacterium]
MEKTRIAINGFGRIGRLVLKASFARGLKVCAINDLADPKTLAHLLKYDSTHGRFPGEVYSEGKTLVVNGRAIDVLSEPQPAKLPWGALGIDTALESTGRFNSRDKAAAHLEAGAGRVVVSAPARDADAVIVLGVNDSDLSPGHRVVSNASCTTNCLAPMVKVLHERFGVTCGTMNTIHSYTNDQHVLDQPHKDLRRARGAGINMIPTTTGAAAAVGEVIPELMGKLNGLSIRVPTPDGSLTDFTAVVKRPTSASEVNEAFRAAAAGPLKEYLEYSEEPLVLSDIIGNPASCIFDAQSTTVVGGTLVKMLGWYDNEWGYANRCADLMLRLAVIQ